MVKEKTIQSIASEMLENMEWKKRTNGDDYVINKINIEWQKDIIHKAHGEKLPDDYIYAFIYEVLSSLVECNAGEEEDAIHEIEADCYTSELTKWLNSRNDRVYYLDEAAANGITDGFQLLAAAQLQEKQEVAWTVLQGIKDRMED